MRVSDMSCGGETERHGHDMAPSGSEGPLTPLGSAARTPRPSADSCNGSHHSAVRKLTVFIFSPSFCSFLQ